MENETLIPLPKRKNIRLPHFDYSSADTYFVTVCVEGRKPLLCSIKSDSTYKHSIELSKYGIILNSIIFNSTAAYSNVKVENYIIMPDHFHLLITIYPSEDNPPSLSDIVRALKTIFTRKIGVSLWQKGYYDHIVRNQKDFDKI